MNVEAARINTLIPDLEAEVYDRYALKGYATEALNPPKVARLRRLVATNSYCLETSRQGYNFLNIEHGITEIRRERHVANIADGSYGHFFLSLPASSPTELTGEDLVIDATYLQYATSQQERAQSPLIYVGQRDQITDLMRNPNFTDKPHAALLYMPDTAVHYINH
jgi:hypothetical protein